MGNELTAVRVQDTYPSVGEGAFVRARANVRGELVSPDFYQQLVADGRVYQINNEAIETPVDGDTLQTFASNGTNPLIYLGVPSGVTVMPLELRLVQAGTVANAVFTTLVAYENKLLGPSGTPATIQNLRTDEPNASACTAYTLATVTAPSQDRLIHGGIYSQDVTAPDHSDQSFHWSARDAIAPLLVGEACFLVYSFVSTKGPSFFYRFVWAEIPTASMT